MSMRQTEEWLDKVLKSGGVKGIAGQTNAAAPVGVRRGDSGLTGSAPAAAAPEKKRSELEVRLEQQIFAAGLPRPETEWYCIPGRNWRMDFAWPLMVPPRYVEVQGMAHRVKERFEADIEKRAHLRLAGWLGLEVSGKTIKDGHAIEWVKKLLEM